MSCPTWVQARCHNKKSFFGIEKTLLLGWTQTHKCTWICLNLLHGVLLIKILTQGCMHALEWKFNQETCFTAPRGRRSLIDHQRKELKSFLPKSRQWIAQSDWSLYVNIRDTELTLSHKNVVWKTRLTSASPHVSSSMHVLSLAFWYTESECLAEAAVNTINLCFLCALSFFVSVLVPN